MEVAASPPANVPPKEAGTLDRLVQCNDQGADHRPSRLHHRVPGNVSDGALKAWGISTHEKSEHTKNGMHHELPSVKETRVPLCNIGDVEGSGKIRGRDGNVLQRLRITENVCNLSEGRGGGNVRNLEGLSAGKILWS
jgi:hypothetical protein